MAVDRTETLGTASTERFACCLQQRQRSSATVVYKNKDPLSTCEFNIITFFSTNSKVA